MAPLTVMVRWVVVEVEEGSVEEEDFRILKQIEFRFPKLVCLKNILK
jgi:hypothetical protein